MYERTETKAKGKGVRNMGENYNDDMEYEARREQRRKRRRRAVMQRTVTMIILLLIVCAAAVFGAGVLLKNRGLLDNFSFGNQKTANTQQDGTSNITKETDAYTENSAENASAAAVAGNDESEVSSGKETEVQTELQTETAAPSAETANVLEEAGLLAAGYDYDGAIELLKSVPSYESDSEITAAISEYEATKATCVAVDVTTVPHIFYHSLINDTDRAFDVSTLGQFQVDGMNAWMTTVEEFDKITQALYDNGYVYVRLRDLVVQTTDENGNVSFSPNTSLMLPPDKKAIVLSIDDLSYYHSYEAAGYPEKLVLDENGDVKCLYTSADGTEQVGDYDVVPRLNTFLKEHPDGAYKGARGLIAMTGYNGVFGYRTDEDYETQQNLMEDQRKWLDAHPDFDRNEEIAEATKIADAIKESGWEFASHTWGHLSVTSRSLEDLQKDNEKWISNVGNIVGTVDTIIFAHGNDIGDWQDYSEDNEKYQYFKSAGYNFYCNVDGSTPYWVQIRNDYVRQGRINLDGYMLYKSSIGETTVIDNLFTASEVFDSRRPTPVVANGEA